MKAQKVAIIGRPNVGKSSLFNRLCKKRHAIVDEEEGTTRDRLYAKVEWFGRLFEVIDTGGIQPKTNIQFQQEITKQAKTAIEEADILILVVDGLVGVTDWDQTIAHQLLQANKPLFLAINKIDSAAQDELIHEFHSLGIPNKIAISASQGRNIAELVEFVFGEHEMSKATSEEIFESPEEDRPPCIAVVGRTNVGKSSLINKLFGDDRCVVSPIPGTTRDSIDVTVEVCGKQYIFLDTAGIRRKHAERDAVDKFASIRTQNAIERADLCLLMIDVQEGMTTQDKRLANLIQEKGKGCILLLNKWDLVQGFRMEHCIRDLEEEIPFLRHCTKLCISAKTGRNLDKLFPLIEEVDTQSRMRIPTGQLNKLIEASIQKNHPPRITGKRLRIYYLTQIGIRPPTFILFVNRPDLMTETYRKYLCNQIRETYGFTGVPIVLHLKGKENKVMPFDDVSGRKGQNDQKDKND